MKGKKVVKERERERGRKLMNFILWQINQHFYLHLQPETVPQSVINMSDVIEVADAEQITGHCHSILIQTPDLSTFVKGTCPEESKWWYNVLVQYVKSKVRHHKRNAFLKGQQQKCESLHTFVFFFVSFFRYCYYN